MCNKLNDISLSKFIFDMFSLHFILKMSLQNGGLRQILLYFTICIYIFLHDFNVLPGFKIMM